MKQLKSYLLPLILGGLFALASAVQAERPDHFEAKPSDTLEEALANFIEYNNHLEKALAVKELDHKGLYEVHQLTYTLEAALEKIREELEILADILEEVHVASEKSDPHTAMYKGHEYLEISRQIIR